LISYTTLSSPGRVVCRTAMGQQELMESFLEHLNIHLTSLLHYLDAPLVYSFIISNPSFYHPILMDGFMKSILSCLHHLIALLQDLSAISYYLLIYLMKILFVCFPYFISFTQTIIEFHQTQLRTSDLIVEALIFTLLLLYLIFRKSILQVWKKLMINLSKKYHDAARVAPHILFFTTAALLTIFGGKFLIPLSSPKILPLFTLARPLFRSFRLWNRVDPSPKSQQDQVVLWTVLGSYFALSSFASMIPFSQYLLSFIPALREFSLVVCLHTLLSLSPLILLLSDCHLDPILTSMCKLSLRINHPSRSLLHQPDPCG
jgi:hypothetical protein